MPSPSSLQNRTLNLQRDCDGWQHQSLSFGALVVSSESDLTGVFLTCLFFLGAFYRDRACSKFL
jgi:hypothetical protein